MLTYNMDVDPRSVWLRTTPGTAALAQPYLCTEAGLFYGQQRFATARTDKESYILFYTLEGAGLVEQNGIHLTLAPGDALLLNCRTPQSYCTAPGQARWHHYWMHIDGPGVRAMEGILNPSATNGQPRLCAAHLHAANAKSWFDTVLASLRSESTAAVVEASLAIHQVLAAMAQVRLDTAAGMGGSNKVLVEQAAEYIRLHYAEELCLDAMLTLAPVSKAYFLRLFRQYMGTTPYNYLLCTRITQAKELLVLTDLPVGEIARRVGFHNESNFSTRFAAMAGQSPLQYRKSALKPQGTP